MSEYVVDESTIFETPLVEVDLDLEADADVYAKVEWFNLYDAPHGGGSIKSRIAKGMLDGAEERGELEPGVTVIEPTSGNTGSEVARLAAARGYDVEIVMPDNAAGGKVEAVRDAGAEIHFAGDEVGHVAVVGTGGTITGTGRGLTDLSDGAVEVVGFEPDEPLHAIDGLKYLKTGDHYHPETYDESVLDRTEYVTTADAYDRARALRERYLDDPVPIADPGQHGEATIREHLRVDDQFVVGTSAGGGAAVVANLDAAGDLADDDVVVFMLCDRGDKYADIPLWEDYL